MKNRKLSCIITALLCALFAASLSANGQTATFTYQGRLMFDGAPAEGLYDFEIELFEASSGGTSIGDSQSLDGVSVTDGLFTVELDFGALIFDGSDRWLEIGVTTNGGASATTLSPRQRITATPYAIKAIKSELFPRAIRRSEPIMGLYSLPPGLAIPTCESVTKRALSM